VEQDFDHQKVEELQQVDTDFNTIALTAPEGANSANA
jgi:hypothetical protein